MSAQAKQLLIELEAALLADNLWSELPPSPVALASTAPFCCDTMPLEQWLQFILLPKMQALLEAGVPLPNNIAISPLAELVYANNLSAVASLLAAIKRLEQCLNQH